MKNRLGHIIRCGAVLLLAIVATSCGTRRIAPLPMGGSMHIASSSLVPMDTTLIGDAAIDSIAAVYRQKMDDQMNMVIGYSDEMMNVERPESSLMRFLSDVVLEMSCRIADKLGIVHPSVCILNTGGIRTSLPEGPVTVRNIFEISPFENSVALVYIKGDDLVSVFEHIALRGGEPISGATMIISGGRLVEAKVDGMPVDKNRMYCIVTNSYLAEGGDGFDILKRCEKHVDSTMIRDMFIMYIRNMTENNMHIKDPGNVRITVTPEK